MNETEPTEAMVEAATNILLEAFRKRAPWLGPWEGHNLTQIMLTAARSVDPLPAELQKLRDDVEHLRTALIEAQSWIEGHKGGFLSETVLARIREALEGTA